MRIAETMYYMYFLFHNKRKSIKSKGNLILYISVARISKYTRDYCMWPRCYTNNYKISDRGPFVQTEPVGRGLHKKTEV